MKILLVHPNPLEDYHLERLVNESLESLGHEVTSLRYREVPEQRVLKLLEDLSGKHDLALILKAETFTQQHYENIKCLSTYWYVDHPKEGELPTWLTLAVSSVDFVLASSYGLLEQLKEYNPQCYWIVEGAHLPLLQPVEAEKEHQLSFFGSLCAETNNGDVFGTRFEFLRHLASKYNVSVFGPDSDRSENDFQFPYHYPTVWNEQLALEIAKSKIVLGYNSTNKVELYWSNRTYTTLACKGFLITPYVPGLEKVFENHKHLVWFHTLEELDEYIEYYLVHPQQRQAIAEAGYYKVRANFTTQQQVERLLNIVDEKSLRLGKKPSVALVVDQGYVGCRGAVEQWAKLFTCEGFAVKTIIANEPVSREFAERYDLIIVNGHSGLYQEIFETKTRAVVVWHSSLLQTQLENELQHVKKIQRLQREGKIETVFCTDRNALKLFDKAKWLPNVYMIKPEMGQEQFVEKGKVNIAVMCPSKQRKNLLTALMMLSYLNDSYRLHINVSDEFYQENVKDFIDESKVVNHGWLSRENYFALISQCDIGIQISVGESYNFVAADHMICGTPIICSASVTAVPSKELKVNNFEDVGELIGKIDQIRRASDVEKQVWFDAFHQQNSYHCRIATVVLKNEFNIPHSIAARSIKTKRPILSIVYHGRNDNYGGDFKRRLCWSLMSIQKAFAELNPEIIFVNWNTKRNTPRLFDEPLFAECRHGVKVYEVPASVHKDLSEKHNYSGVYLEWYAKNFGVRRAQGEYILQLNSDNLIFDNITIDDLPLKGQTFVATRTEVDAKILNLHPNQVTDKDLVELKKQQWIPDIDRPHYVGGSCGEFVLAHRDLWYEVCGNVETSDRYCIDNVTATHFRTVSELTIFPYNVYHIAHPSATGSWPGFDYPLGYSGKDWGLPKLYVEPICYED